MNEYKAKTLSWRVADGVVELALDSPPANEIGLAMLAVARRGYPKRILETKDIRAVVAASG